MDLSGKPWQAIAVTVCVLGLTVSGWAPTMEDPLRVHGADDGKARVSQVEAAGGEPDLVYAGDDGLLAPPYLSVSMGASSDAIQRYLDRLGELEEVPFRPIDLTLPSLIVDPCVLTEGMSLFLADDSLLNGEQCALPEPVLVLVFGNVAESNLAGPSESDPAGGEDDGTGQILNGLHVTLTSDDTRVLYCDPSLMTEPGLFLVLSPAQSVSMTLQP